MRDVKRDESCFGRELGVGENGLRSFGIALFVSSLSTCRSDSKDSSLLPYINIELGEPRYIPKPPALSSDMTPQSIGKAIPDSAPHDAKALNMLGEFRIDGKKQCHIRERSSSYQPRTALWLDPKRSMHCINSNRISGWR